MMETPSRQRDTRDIVRGALVNLVGILARSLNVILLIVLGRLYGPEGVGLYLLTLATVDTFSNLGILGLDQAVLSRAARHYTDGDMDGMYRTIGQALWLGLLLTLTVAAGIELLAPWCAQTFFNKPALSQSLRIVAVVLPFWTTSAVLLFATRALRVMQYEVITKSVVEPAVMLTLATVFSVLDFGLFGLWIAVLVSAVMGTITAGYCFTRRLSLSRLWHHLFASQGRWPLYRFALPIGLVDLLSELSKRADMFLIGRYLATDFLGIYGIAQEAAAAMKKIRQAFHPIVIPVLSASHQKQDRDSMLHQFRNVTRWILLLSTSVVMGMVLLGRAVLGLFGDAFTPGFSALILLTLALAINNVLGVAELVLLIDKPWVNFLNACGTLVGSILLNLLLIPRYGIAGAALATLLLYVMLNTARLLEVVLMYRLQPLTPYHARAALAGAVALGLVWGGQTAVGVQSAMAHLGAVLLCWVVYAALLRLFGLALEEQEVLEKWRKRLSPRSW